MIVTHKGLQYPLTQDAYADNYGTDGQVRYYAHATGPDGEVYLIAWDTTAAWDADPDQEDQGDACDWDNPVEVQRV